MLLRGSERILVRFKDTSAYSQLLRIFDIRLKAIIAIIQPGFGNLGFAFTRYDLPTIPYAPAPDEWGVFV